MNKLAGMIKLKGVSRNAFFSGLQAVSTLIIVFITYRIFVREFGIERVGLWSLLLATTSLARVADITGAGGLSRFVARALADGRDAASYVHTITIAMGFLYVAIGLSFLTLYEPLLNRIIDPSHLDEALDLMPWAIAVGLFFTPIGATLASGIDGTHRADFRSVLVICSSLVFLFTTFLLLPKYGIYSWPMALIAQQLFIILGAWVIMRKLIDSIGVFPHKLSLEILRETMHYGAKLQINNLASMFSEPLLKFFLNTYSGLEAVGLYELASRFVLSLRSIIVQMATPIIPEFVSLQRSNSELTFFLRKTVKYATIASAIIFVLILVSSPAYSYIMIGDVSIDLIFIISVVALGASINLISVPYYFLGLALNFLRWNIIAQFFMASSIVVLGGALGPYYSTGSVLSGLLLGHVGGAIIVILGNRNLMK